MIDACCKRSLQLYAIVFTAAVKAHQTGSSLIKGPVCTVLVVVVVTIAFKPTRLMATNGLIAVCYF